MAQWADYPSVEDEHGLQDLLTELHRLKPRGWSVVLGDLRDITKEIRDYLLGIKGAAKDAGTV